MYLGKSTKRDDWVNPVAEALGIQGTQYEFIVAPYFIALFTPFLLVVAYVLPDLLAKLL